jgi:hypothetical protein
MHTLYKMIHLILHLHPISTFIVVCSPPETITGEELTIINHLE